ncbi:P-loop containing nucleoside triphosphate hydrolase protein [Stipitochalara longipes BDJ]|nr:P-loop containing nucleoside triphosphate hydrolase protein [Stipitochalara longipes BDJ]
MLSAKSKNIQNNPRAFQGIQDGDGKSVRIVMRNDYQADKKTLVEYLSIFESTWFILEHKLYLVRLNGNNIAKGKVSESSSQLITICLGWSLTPLKRFIKVCQDHSDKNSENFTQLWSTKGGVYFDWIIKKPHRAMNTVYFDQDVKNDLCADIQNYLNPNNRRFYNARGIPYRRGYLFHGPPGTGKTSLSLALAGRFGLDLYRVHLPSIRSDHGLEMLFSDLPALYIVLLEDIDAVGLERHSKGDAADDNELTKTKSRQTTQLNCCTLSGVLNVLDGVASQEGRIVLMTSNFADDLDEALIRPGRIDKQIFLGHLSPKTAMQMFIGIELALEFSRNIPTNIFAPAQIQGYVLQYRESAADAAAKFSKWIEKEKAKALEREARKKKATKKRFEKQNEPKREGMLPEKELEE